MALQSPLEQFDLIHLLSLRLAGLDLSPSSLSLTLAVVLAGLLGGVLFLAPQSTLIPSAGQQFLELLYHFLWGLLQEQAGEEGAIYVPLFLSLFVFILSANLLSLLPFGIAVTSHVVITLFLSFSLIFTLFLWGLVHQRWYFIRLFLPHCPLPLLFLLIPIELFSYFVRCFSLAIRLSANILAGHTLVAIVAGFTLQLAQWRLWLLLPMLGLLLLLFALEFGVAFLQAYVFVVLLAIYLRDSLYTVQH